MVEKIIKVTMVLIISAIKDMFLAFSVFPERWATHFCGCYIEAKNAFYTAALSFDLWVLYLAIPLAFIFIIIAITETSEESSQSKEIEQQQE